MYFGIGMNGMQSDSCVESRNKSDIQPVHPDNKVHMANMGPTWGRQDLGGPHERCYLGLYM